MVQPTSDIAAREKVFDLIKGIKVALLVTHNAATGLGARPMVAQGRDANGDLWFFTGKNSPKVAEIEQNAETLLAYSEPADQNYVSLTGDATIVDDRAKIHELWNEAAVTWFPKGKDDPNICLIRFTPKAAEYWDAPSSAIVYAYGYLKAKLTGEAPHPGENKQVRIG